MNIEYLKAIFAFEQGKTNSEKEKIIGTP